MVLRLSKGAADRQNWQSSIEFVKEYYQNDDLVEITPNYIVFKAREHPVIRLSLPLLLLNTDSDLMANMYIVLNCRRKLEEHPYGYYGMELKLAFSSL
jgi:hypothetical protein